VCGRQAPGVDCSVKPDPPFPITIGKGGARPKENRWLEKYAYKMQLSPVVLILTLSFALFITIVTNIRDIINTMALLGLKKVFCLT